MIRAPVGESPPVPEAWIGREVHLRYTDADAPRSLDCTITEIGDRGVCVASGAETSFFPWSSVIRIDLGHSRFARGRGSG